MRTLQYGPLRVCPQCHGQYSDGALLVCPRDGSALLADAPTHDVTGDGLTPGAPGSAATSESPPTDLIRDVARLLNNERALQTQTLGGMPLQSGSPEERLGEVLGSYRLIELIGQGGMGWVYRAEHIKLGRQVALKLLRLDRIGRRDAVTRFFHEARTVNRIRHRNIVDITDLVELDSGATFIIMELLAGLTLGEWTRVNPGETGHALELAVQICDGLSAAHRIGVIHRDLKPDNIFVVPMEDGSPLIKLLDFGIAKLHDEDEIGTDSGAGSILGTPAYMSPEQAGGHPVDARSDIYSLGAILYELFTHERMFQGKSLGEYIRKHLQETPTPPSQTRDGATIDPHLEEVILRCLAKNPADRYDSVDELRAELAAMSGAMNGDRSLGASRYSGLSAPSGSYARSAGNERRAASMPAVHRTETYTRRRRPAILMAAQRPWVWALAMTTTAGAALLFYLPSSRTPAPQSAADSETTATMAGSALHAPAVPVTVHFDSMPSAEVTLVGSTALHCRTPCDLTVPPSPGKVERQFEFRRPGYHPAQVELDLRDPWYLVYVRLDDHSQEQPAGPYDAPAATSRAAGDALRNRTHKAAHESTHEPPVHTDRKQSGARPAAPRKVDPSATLDPFGSP